MFRHRVLALTSVAAAAGIAAAPHVAAACDTNACVPQVASVTPLQIVLTGKPVTITLQGYYFTGTVQVLMAPVLPVSGFTVQSDSTLLVTLPANIVPSIYSVRVVTTAGSSDPTLAPQFQVFPALPPTPPPTPTPKATPTPKPTATPKPPVPETGVVQIAAAAAHPANGAGGSGSGGSADGIGSGSSSSGSLPPAVLTGAGQQVSPVSAPIDIMAGLALGAILYLLWGSPRRLSGSWRRAPLVHLVGRPVQALHVGLVCLYCGKLHFIWNTRRDLWKEQRYCGPKCFISAEAMPNPLAEEDEPEPVLEGKKAAWWRAAVATEPGVGSESAGWRPRF